MPHSESTRPSEWRVALICALPLLAVLIAFRYSFSQDGPAHLYTADVLVEREESPLRRETFEIDVGGVPNVAAQVLLAALIPVTGALIADKVVWFASFALIVVGGVVLSRVTSSRMGVGAVLLLSYVALNRLWLLGFYSFLLGAGLALLTIALWWRVMKRLDIAGGASLAAAFLLLFFAHLVSYGIAVTAALVLAVATRGVSAKRLGILAVALLPSLLFVARHYTNMTTQGSPLPSYGKLRPASIASWWNYAHNVKLLSLADQESLPFTGVRSDLFVIFSPAVLAALVLIIALAGVVRRVSFDDERRPWMILSVVLFTGGFLAPNSFGVSHGEFLRERLLLAALAIAVSTLQLDLGRWKTALAVAAFILQLSFVADYAQRSTRIISPLVNARVAAGQAQRLFVITEKELGTKFKASPELHASNLLSVGNANVAWNNYEAMLYYFPIRYRKPLEQCRDESAVGLAPTLEEKGRWWRCTIKRERERIDRVVFWNVPPEVDAAVLKGERATLVQGGTDVRVYALR